MPLTAPEIVGKFTRACALLLLTVPVALAGQLDFHIATVHLDGNANTRGDAAHPPEPFPATPLTSSGGLMIRAPDDAGAWSVRAFVFQPSHVTAFEGDDVTLHFVGVHGPSHTIVVDGMAPVVLRRGEVRSIRLPAVKPGVIGFESSTRLPSMRGQLLVLPKP